MNSFCCSVSFFCVQNVVVYEYISMMNRTCIQVDLFLGLIEYDIEKTWWLLLPVVWKIYITISSIKLDHRTNHIRNEVLRRKVKRSHHMTRQSWCWKISTYIVVFSLWSLGKVRCHCYLNLETNASEPVRLQLRNSEDCISLLPSQCTARNHIYPSWRCFRSSSFQCHRIFFRHNFLVEFMRTFKCSDLLICLKGRA